MKIDSHQHFWNYNTSMNNWIDDNMHVLRKNYLPADLQLLLKQNNFDGCITVQVNETAKENDYMLALAANNIFIKGIVGWVNLCSNNVEASLEKYTEHKIIKGFRHILQSEDNAFMLQPFFINGISKLRQYNFTYDVLIKHHQLKNACKLASLFPQQKFVIDHIAKPLIKENNINEWKKDLKDFAGLSNVYCKISGLVTEADWYNWKQDDFTPYLDAVLETFGTGRIMFGSDWPVCLPAAEYDDVVKIAENYMNQFSSAEKEKFFGLNAVRFYNLE